MKNHTPILILLISISLSPVIYSAKMRVWTDVTFIQNTTIKSYVDKELLPVIRSYLYEAINLKYPEVNPIKGLTSDTCANNEYTTSLTQGLSNQDLAIILNDKSDIGDSAFIASTCQRSRKSFRVIIGRIKVRQNLPVPTLNTPSKVLLHEKNILFLLHEFFHILGIGENHFPYYIQANGSLYSIPPGELWSPDVVRNATYAASNMRFVVVESAKTTARNFFNCQTLPGIPYENDGGLGTGHLERKWFYWDFMSQGGQPGQKISPFSTAILRATGWYDFDETMEDYYTWGKDAGCSFLSLSCSARERLFADKELCNITNQLGCTFFGRSAANCTSPDVYMSPCRVEVPFNYESDCENADYSGAISLDTKRLQYWGRDGHNRCFIGNLSVNARAANTRSYCFRSDCVPKSEDEPNVFILQVKIGNQTEICDAKGKVLTYPGYQGGVTCPDPKEFCANAGFRSCPRKCMGLGNCVYEFNTPFSSCDCFDGWKGGDCTLREASGIWN